MAEVSIIMPAHNAGAYLREALASVMGQTFPDWELLLMDDASTDDTPAIVQGLGDPRIRYYRLERVGHPAGVRNAGLRRAQGAFITFLDADDVYYPDTLARMLAGFAQNPTRQALYGFAEHMDAAGQRIPSDLALVPDGHGGYGLPTSYRHAWEPFIMGQLSCLLPALMLRRSLLERVGGFNEALVASEDYEFYMRLLLADFDAVACVPQYFYRYRVYRDSMTKAPAWWEKILTSEEAVAEWLFQQPFIVQHYGHLQSPATAERYRYIARERLLQDQPTLARAIALKALDNPAVRFPDWLRACGPLVMRSALPGWINTALIQWRRRFGGFQPAVQAQP